MIFLAGADIREMQNKQFHDVAGGGFLEQWTEISEIRKPIIAAVNGYAVRLFAQFAFSSAIVSFFS